MHYLAKSCFSAFNIVRLHNEIHLHQEDTYDTATGHDQNMTSKKSFHWMVINCNSEVQLFHCCCCCKWQWQHQRCFWCSDWVFCPPPPPQLPLLLFSSHQFLLCSHFPVGHDWQYSWKSFFPCANVYQRCCRRAWCGLWVKSEHLVGAVIVFVVVVVVVSVL